MISRSIFIEVGRLRTTSSLLNHRVKNLLDYCFELNLKRVIDMESLDHLPIHRGYLPYRQNAFDSGWSQEFVNSNEFDERTFSAVNHLVNRTLYEVISQFNMAHKEDPALILNLDTHLVNTSHFIIAVDVLYA